MTPSQIEERFRNIGGVFLTPASVLASRLSSIRALVFDWDGVFNGGFKDAAGDSGFSEPDSMGTNMLRFALWRVHAVMPAFAVISGERNEIARQFVEREHFNAIYMGVRHKDRALASLCAQSGIEPAQVAFVFDDINDLSMAAQCGVRILVRRDCSPLLQDFVAYNSLCDYVTGAASGAYPVRESAELLMGLMGVHDQTVASRVAFDEHYEAYFSARQSIQTKLVVDSDAVPAGPGG